MYNESKNNKLENKLKELRNKGVSILLSNEKINSMSSEAKDKMIEIMEEFEEED